MRITWSIWKYIYNDKTTFYLDVQFSRIINDIYFLVQFEVLAFVFGFVSGDLLVWQWHKIIGMYELHNNSYSIINMSFGSSWLDHSTLCTLEKAYNFGQKIGQH